MATPTLPDIQFSEKNLRSIAYNLLSDAVKYHSPDCTPRVNVRAHMRPSYTVLEVHDNGFGIDLVHLPKLFTMSQRFHDRVDGSGIGLYMVKRMVENTGGRIEVHFQLGQAPPSLFICPTPRSQQRRNLALASAVWPPYSSNLYPLSAEVAHT